MKRLIRVAIYSILTAALSAAAFFILPAKVQYHLTERYGFTADQAGTKISLAVMLPKDNAYQDVDNLKITWKGNISLEDYPEVDIVKLSNHSINEEAILEYDVTLFQGKIEWERKASERDLLPQKDIESNQPLLIYQAKEVCSDSADDAASETYLFTSAYLTWPEETRIGGGQSALAAYKSQIGGCGEFANLMTALNRACDNPARSINGLAMPQYLPPRMTMESSWMHPGGAHAWVEVFDRDHWTIADPSLASNWPLDGIWFGRSLGQYLSYGESGDQARIYDEILKWAEDNGELIGAMSAPIKFVSSSADTTRVTITPTVSVKKVRDARWIAAGGMFLMMIAASSLAEKWIVKKRLSKTNGQTSGKQPSAK